MAHRYVAFGAPARAPSDDRRRNAVEPRSYLPRIEVERAINEAEFHRLTDPLSLHDLVARYPGRRGVATIKAILREPDWRGKVTRSELESRFLAFAHEIALPQPEINARLFVPGRWLECDCVWRNQRVVAELDGFRARTTRATFERDRARDRALQADGWQTVRVTWRQLHKERVPLAADLKEMLCPTPSASG
jgi:hypothetical protein